MHCSVSPVTSLPLNVPHLPVSALLLKKGSTRRRLLRLQPVDVGLVSAYSIPFYIGLVSACSIPCSVGLVSAHSIPCHTLSTLCLQVLVVSLCIFLLSLADTYYPYSRGALLTSCVVLYALTAGFAGYTSSMQYKLMNGDNWVSRVARSPVWELPLHPTGSTLLRTQLHAQSQMLSPGG